jgi:hypothetical protein
MARAPKPAEGQRHADVEAGRTMKPKIKWAGAPLRKRRTSEVKSKSGRPRRHQPSQDYIKTVVRPWIPSALLGITGGHVGPPMTKEDTKEFFLSALRGMTDDLTIAEEAYHFWPRKTVAV